MNEDGSLLDSYPKKMPGMFKLSLKYPALILKLY